MEQSILQLCRKLFDLHPPKANKLHIYSQSIIVALQHIEFIGKRIFFNLRFIRFVRRNSNISLLTQEHCIRAFRNNFALTDNKNEEKNHRIKRKESVCMAKNLRQNWEWTKFVDISESLIVMSTLNAVQTDFLFLKDQQSNNTSSDRSNFSKIKQNRYF